jgi:hypothetical protein
MTTNIEMHAMIKATERFVKTLGEDTQFFDNIEDSELIAYADNLLKTAEAVMKIVDARQHLALARMQAYLNHPSSKDN